jgi:hypothetical protein
MDIENDLTKDELAYLIEKLSRENDEATLSDADSESVTQEVQADLRARLQRGIEDLRSNNEDVPADILRLLERL